MRTLAGKKANNFVLLVLIPNVLGTLRQVFSWAAGSGYRCVKEVALRGGQPAAAHSVCFYCSSGLGTRFTQQPNFTEPVGIK